MATLSAKEKFARLNLSKLPEDYQKEFKTIHEGTENFSDEDLISIFQENFDDLYNLVEKKYPDAIETGGTIKKTKPTKIKVVRKKKDKEVGQQKPKYEYKGYAKMISEATGVTDPEDLAYIEDIMRNDIFHSTLDWQSKKEFDDAAREAKALMPEMKKADAEIGITNWGKRLLGKSGKLSVSDIEFIEDQLTNNEASTDEELITMFVVELGISEAQSKKWVARRDKYLNKPVEKRIKYSERTKLKKDSRRQGNKQIVKTRDGHEFDRQDPANKGKSFYDENGKKWKCERYSTKLDECIFADEEGKEISGCLRDMYVHNPVDKRKKGDIIDECRETLKEAGYKVLSHKKGSKKITRKEPRPEKEIIKERVENTFTPITKDLVKSDEAAKENKEVVEVLNRIQNLFVKVFNRISNLADDGKAEKLEKIEKLLIELIE
jgi:hypothetical protein